MAITYTPTTNFGAKDTLPTNDPDKVIKGTEFTTEFIAIQTAFSLAAPNASPTFTGTVTIPTADINGGAIDGTAIGANSASTGAFTTLTASGDVNFDSGTFFVDASADAVGIGTTSPAEKLAVVTARSYNQSADVAISVGGTDNGFVDNGKTSAWRFNVTGNALNGQSLGFEGFVRGGTWTERMRIDSSGNLGIGTSTPASKLSIAAGDILLDNTRSIIFKDNGGVARGILQYFSDNSTYLDAPNGNTVFRNGTSNTEKMRITSSGNVGIGTSSPSSKLHLNAASATDVTITQSNSVASTLATQSADGSYYLYNYGAYNLIFGTSSTERMRIDAVGNVGIGTTNPGEKLAVHGDSGNIVGVFETSTGNTNRLWLGATSTESYIDATAGVGATNMVFKVASTERARIDSSGNLLVGTTSNTINANGFIAQSDGVTKVTSTSDPLWVNRRSSTGTLVNFYNDSVLKGTISTNGTTVSYNISSDARLKENIVSAPSASDDIDALTVRSFDWKSDGSHQKYGMVAQELLEVAPEVVHQPDDPEEMMGVDYSKLVPMLVKEIQSLRARVAQLEGV